MYGSQLGEVIFSHEYYIHKIVDYQQTDRQYKNDVLQNL